MTKQEFMAMSIFSNLKYLDDNNKIVELHCVDNGIGLVNFGWGDAKEFTNVKPILHPLSSLTKEIEHEGEKFYPIDKILENSCFNLSKMTRKEIDSHADPFIMPELMSLDDALMLCGWHFDIAGLIEKNEAIDVNTLTENPYK